jgi:hypothetical protein
MFKFLIEVCFYLFKKFFNIFRFLYYELVKDIIVWAIRVLGIKLKKPKFISLKEYKKLSKCPKRAYCRRKKNF